MHYRFSRRTVLLGTLLLPAVLPAAIRIVRVEMGSVKNDDDQIVGPTTVFAPDTPMIYCTWRSEGLKVGLSVRGVWIAENVGSVAPPNYKIAEKAITTLVANQGYFSLSKPNNGFPVGKYRLEIFIGNELLRTVPFNVLPRST
jgi:hypothetical protein